MVGWLPWVFCLSASSSLASLRDFLPALFAGLSKISSSEELTGSIIFFLAISAYEGEGAASRDPAVCPCSLVSFFWGGGFWVYLVFHNYIWFFCFLTELFCLHCWLRRGIGVPVRLLLFQLLVVVTLRCSFGSRSCCPCFLDCDPLVCFCILALLCILFLQCLAKWPYP
jgi:hypothetical protein